MQITCPSPAKLNLCLNIIGRRPDGYHQLQTVFQFLDLCDTLHFTKLEDGQLNCQSSARDLLPTQDLTLKAAQLLRDYSGARPGVSIQVEKHIPMGGGLGGGSSNAATALLVLNHLWELHLPRKTLIHLGLQLGADVPIFISGQAAWAEGIGEQLTPVNPPTDWYLIIHPGCSVSTGAVFNAEELTRDNLPVKIADFIQGYNKNVCETVVRRRYPEVDAALYWLGQYADARLTGTGACIFAAFPKRDIALEIQQQVPGKWQSFIAHGCNRSPAHETLQRLATNMKMTLSTGV